MQDIPDRPVSPEMADFLLEFLKDMLKYQELIGEIIRRMNKLKVKQSGTMREVQGSGAGKNGNIS